MARIDIMEVVESDLAELNRGQLVQIYNKISGKPIKQFKDHTTAVKRTLKALDEYLADNSEPAGTPTGTPNGTGRKGRAPANPDEMVVRWAVDKNPKREGTKAHLKFALLKDGITLGQYRALEGTQPELDHIKGWPNGEVLWCLDKGFITLEKPKS